VLDARSLGVPYLETPDGWVDLRAPAFRHLDTLLGRYGRPEDREGDRLRFTPGELLGLQAATGRAIAVEGEGDAAGAEGAEEAREQEALVRRLVEVRPSAPYEHPEGLETPLRPYQERGVEWLRFLWENRLGGILADDMGLGKTHQAMALMALLRAGGRSEGVRAPMLVVCPTSVMSHWRDKLRDHAPGLRAAVHHGPGRDLRAALEEAGVLVTSYGVLRRDAGELAEVPWALAVFDEIQNLKNPATHGWRAAVRVPAAVRLGLTGTPIENSLGELKALFDLVLPGYLGSDRSFEERFGDGEELPGRERLDELRRLVAPFILRRTKAAVLDELPEKIEDVRTARLSDDQVTLYREAIAGRGEELAGKIAAGAEPVPYIHVFALLSLLKQICDHPALVLRTPDGEPGRAEESASGKWDLYRELLSECLEAGLKVVVFSQYLGMLELMARDLDERGVGYAKLTGASRKRGEIVGRFNRDPECRVFLGSLKAGGTGIDLVGGSVVIHYDRWWNAAREDQATDRVHRIGQHRAVQVFKLVTEGTLEEKIHALIERKRTMMNAVVREDDHRLAKIFTRDELLDLLSEPS
jgi:SNF2 family DNA or RNA helicase